MVLRPFRSAKAANPDSDIALCVCEENMSTSVYNPFTFNEVSRIRAVARRPPVDAGALARVRRDLFGPVNHEDARKFVMRELAVQQKLSSDRWGFDFEREEPIKGENVRYFWEKVTAADNVPKAYDHGEYHAITTTETITTAPDDTDVTVAAPTPPASPLDAASSTCPSTSPRELTTARPTVPSVQPAAPIKKSSSQKSSLKRRRTISNQKKITDFLRIRKSTSIGAKAAKLRRLAVADSRPVSDQPV